MKTIEEYFAHVCQLVQGFSEAHVERYEEQVLTETRGNPRSRLRFLDGALLEISEAVVFIHEEPQWLSYRYHYQDPSEVLVFRYDNALHPSKVSTYPDHKHAGDHILASFHPSIEQVLLEMRAFRDREEKGASEKMDS